MTNQQGAPEALFYADALDRCAEVDFDHIFVPAAAVIRRLHAENERLAALVEAQQPAPSAAAGYVIDLIGKLVQAESNKTRTHQEYLGKAMPDDVYARFQRLRDETIPALRTQLLDALAAPPQPSPTPQADSAPASVAGPMQFGGCPECGSRSCVARECSRTVSHAAQAIPGVQWQCGPQASGFTAPQADSQPAAVLTSETGGDWTQPTTIALRLGDAMQLLCGGKRPPDDMVQQWLDNTSESLQEFAASNGPAWAQGIGLIDAAMVMVDQPTEITAIDNPDRDHEHRAARAQAADSVLEDAALSSEQQRAIFEAYESAASESYFEVRPQIDCSDRRRVFKAGYERGWDAARKQGANHD